MTLDPARLAELTPDALREALKTRGYRHRPRPAIAKTLDYEMWVRRDDFVYVPLSSHGMFVAAMDKAVLAITRQDEEIITAAASALLAELLGEDNDGFARPRV